jgi:hypothetical protein
MAGQSQTNNEAVEGIVVHHPHSPESPTTPPAEAPTHNPTAATQEIPLSRAETPVPPRTTPTPRPEIRRPFIPIAPRDTFMGQVATRRPQAAAPATAVAPVPVRTVAPARLAPQPTMPEPEQPSNKSRRGLALLGATLLLTAVAAAGKVGFDHSSDTHAAKTPVIAEGTLEPIPTTDSLEQIPTITAPKPEASVPILIPTSPSEAATAVPNKTAGQNSTESSSSPTHAPVIIIPRPTPSISQAVPAPHETVTPVNPVETAPSAEAVNLLSGFVDSARTQTLRENYQGVDDALNFDALRQSGDINNIQAKDIDHHQKLTKQLYAKPEVSSRLGTIAWLSADSLRANQANGDSPALQLLAQTDNALRGAQDVYPYAGDAIASLPFINRDYTRSAKARLHAGDSLWVPNAQNAFVAAVRVVRLSDGSSAAFAAICAQYDLNGQSKEVVSWKLLEPTTDAGQFTAVTVLQRTLESKPVQTPEPTFTPEATPTETPPPATDNTNNTSSDWLSAAKQHRDNHRH